MSTLLHEIEQFLAVTGLSEHRAGILLARNGRLIPRLRAGKRVWPETEMAVRKAIQREISIRAPDAQAQDQRKAS